MPVQSVCILDYGSGNVRSVFNMISSITDQVSISNNPAEMAAATHIILPGVGAFGASMESIKEKIPLNDLEELVFIRKVPFLGICVGMQVLANYGHEFGKFKGLGWVDGEVNQIKADELPLPHIGWNNIEIKIESPLLKNLPSGTDFYFVHSFVLNPNDEGTVVATTDYGENFCAMVEKDNIYGVQFHPEKSQKAGRQLLQNFLDLKN